MKTGTDAKGHRFGPRHVSGAVGALVVLVGVMVGSLGSASGAGDVDLALTKSDTPDPVVKNATLTYTIQVSSVGALANDAENVVVTDTLPGDVSFTSATTTTGSCSQAAGVVTCNLGTLAQAASATITIVTKPTKAGTLSNTATVGTTANETNPANNADTETTTVNNAASTGKGNKGKGKGKGKGKKKVSCKKPTIVGTIGNDVLFGTPATDVIATFSGNDRVFAGGGNDIVCAGLGRDRVDGGPGGDSLSGSGGRDRLKGRTGRDFLDGGRSRDRCRGGPGRDTLVRCP